MLSNNPLQYQFVFFFPDTFYDSEILERYNTWLGAYPDYHDSFDDVLNESIKEIELPGLDYTPLTQEVAVSGGGSLPIHQQPPGVIDRVIDKTITVNMRHTEAYMTYWFLYEHFDSFYKKKKAGLKNNMGTFSVQLKNEEGLTVTTVNYTNILFTGIDSLPLSYDRTNPNFGTFSLKFVFQEFGTLFTLPEINIKK